MRIVSVPHIKHGQALKRKQARKFISESRAWLKYASRRINELKFSARSSSYILQKARIIEEGLDKIQRQLEWLEGHSAENGKVRYLLARTRERLEGLMR